MIKNKTDNNPLVTVNIPTFNRKDLLKRTLESVLNQTYKNLDILVADNCSDDGTEEMMLEYCKQDARIRYFRHEKNMGVGYQGVFCLDNALGNYSMFVCDDDYISKDYIEECVKMLSDNPDIVSTYGTVCLIDENNNIIKRNETFVARENDYKDRIAKYIQVGSSNYIASAFLDTNLYKEVIASHDKNRFCEDQLTMIKLLFFGKFKSSKKAVYHKLNNGCTKDIENLKRAFGFYDMTYDNFWEYLAEAYKDSLFNDDFYNEKLSHEERKKLQEVSYKNIKLKYAKKEKTNLLKKICKMIKTKCG